MLQLLRTTKRNFAKSTVTSETPTKKKVVPTGGIGPNTFLLAEKLKPKPAEELEVGDTLLGINIFTNEKDPILKPLEDYPPFLTELYEKVENDEFAKEYHFLDQVEVTNISLWRAWNRQRLRMNNVRMATDHINGIFRKRTKLPIK